MQASPLLALDYRAKFACGQKKLYHEMPAEEAILDQINSFMADWRAFLAVFQRGYTVSSSIFYSAFIPLYFFVVLIVFFL